MAERKNLAALIQAPDPAPAAPAPAPAARPARPDRTAKPDKPVRPESTAKPAPAPVASEMTMRSWYMPRASSDRLAALVDDIHFATRLPKHLIMGALVNVLDRHRDEVEAEARAVGGPAE
jgi:hypothetical protein